MKILVGDGLLLSFGKKWASRRKILTPAFHFSILKEFVSLFDRQSGVLVERLSRHCNEKVIDIQPFIKLMTLDVVCETAMGVTINAQTDQNHEYVEAVSTWANSIDRLTTLINLFFMCFVFFSVSEIISTRFAQLWQRSEFLFSIFAYDRKREFNKCVEILHNFTESVIENRRKELKDEKNNKRATVASDDIGTKSKMSFLDVLLKSSENGKPLTNRDIRDEVDTFMFEVSLIIFLFVFAAILLISWFIAIIRVMIQRLVVSFSRCGCFHNINRCKISYLRKLST